jgi:hypothetical protein
MAAGPLILLLFTEATPLVWLAVPYLIFGAGYGMLNAPINNTAISDLPDDQAGVASAMISTAKQVGSVLGIAIVGTILVSGTGGNLAAGLVTASTLAWWLLAACGGAIAVTGPHSLLRALVGCSCKGLGGSRGTAWRGRRLTATMTPPLSVLPRPWNRQQRDAP